MPKYRVFSGPHFPAIGPNAEKYGPEKTPYLDTFHAVTAAHNFPLFSVQTGQFLKRLLNVFRSFAVLFKVAKILIKITLSNSAVEPVN